MPNHSDAPDSDPNCVIHSVHQREPVTLRKTPEHCEYERKTGRITMRIPMSLLEAIKAQAQSRNIPYQRLIREAVEITVAKDHAKQVHL